MAPRQSHRAITLTILTILLAAVLPAAQTVEEKKEAKGLPLQATEKIEFTTDEGTWLSLDVSPDGHMIVFDLLRDIYTLPVAGGEAKRVIGGIFVLRFRPNGSDLGRSFHSGWQ